MRRLAAIAALTALLGAGVGVAAGEAPAATTGGSSRGARLAPIAMRMLGDTEPIPVATTDNALHVLYELAVVNTRGTPVTIDRVEVRAIDSELTVTSFDGPALESRLRRVDGSPVTGAVLAPGEQVFLFVDAGLFAGTELPLLLGHRVTIGDRQFGLAGVSVGPAQAASLDPPVQGRNWVVLEGCCGPESTSRTAVYATEAGYSTPGRFAVELAQMDDQGRFLTGDPADLTSYPSYGQYVGAVAGGRVVRVVDGQPDRLPGLPVPFEELDEGFAEGNSVVVDLGRGRYALYHGLLQGSIIVQQGTFVRRGQALAQIGNSGVGGMPRLHFELLSLPDRIGAEGLPFVLNSFAYAGRVDPDRLAALGPAGPFLDGRIAVPQVRSAQLPLGSSILDFESAAGSSGNPRL